MSERESKRRGDRERASRQGADKVRESRWRREAGAGPRATRAVTVNFITHMLENKRALMRRIHSRAPCRTSSYKARPNVRVTALRAAIFEGAKRRDVQSRLQRVWRRGDACDIRVRALKGAI